MPPDPFEQETIRAGEIAIRITSAGPADGTPVLLLHGFPELAHSWRHQIRALAGAGYRAIAPDMRGTGGTDAPADVEAYDILALTGDVVELLDALGIGEAPLVGHDWGAEVAWRTAQIHPQRVPSVAALSVPFLPRAPVPPLGILREYVGEDHHFVWFQEPGMADAALARDVRRTLATRKRWTPEWAALDEDPPTPPWFTEEDLALIVAEYERTGFTGGINWYRNLDRNWRLLEPYPDRVDQPALFITGSRDPVARVMPAAVMEGRVPDLRELVIEGAGHWVQQERPAEVNEALLDFLG